MLLHCLSAEYSDREDCKEFLDFHGVITEKTVADIVGMVVNYLNLHHEEL